MLSKKIVCYFKDSLAVISFMVIFSIAGCKDAPKQLPNELENESQSTQDDAGEIIDICLDLYERAAIENRTDELEMVRCIVERFGEHGYPAVDSENQINMTEYEQVESFCKMVEIQEEAEIEIIKVDYLGGFVKYDLQTKDGKVDVVRSYYEYENGNMQKGSKNSYRAEYWNYTEEGYLIFSGVWYSEELYALTASAAEENIALRVQPLDETYRELSRKYLRPIGFEQNNMFLVDWSEEDFGELNFYDMYDVLYENLNDEYVPYVAAVNAGEGVVYQIPEKEFESVIMAYFNVDSQTLRSKTVYFLNNRTYEYKPRGFYEVEYPEYPFSEVFDFTENSDGTITLIANVVFPYAGNPKVYSHEVIVRPFEDGRVQYVSNHVIPSEENEKETWHTPRLSAEEWEELYGGE